MCTAVRFAPKDCYFGRNLDLHISYGEGVVITPRNKPLPFRLEQDMPRHYALIGMAIVQQDYPLYFDAMNEVGLAMAGLNFPGNAAYFPPMEGKKNITPFEFIPWLLGQCASVEEARQVLKEVNLVDLPFAPQLPLSPLHWMIADERESIVVEQMADGLKIYDNPADVLANNPPFDYHLHNLNNYLNLTCEEPENRFAPQLPLQRCCLGMGGIGLPGDLSSPSRFVRAAFVRHNCIGRDTEAGNVNQFFHILDSVAQPFGCSSAGKGEFEYTVYSAGMNLQQGSYYYKTYENSRIHAVELRAVDLDGDALHSYPLLPGPDFCRQN